MIRIMIVDDQAMLLDLLKIAVDSQEDMEVVSILTDASLAPEKVDCIMPDIVLMDVCTENDQSGIAATRRIKDAHPEVHVLVMTGLPEITFVRQAREAGADGFIYKNLSTSDLLSAIRSTVEGYTIFPREKADDIFHSGLSEDEIDILRLYCEAKSRNEIADELHLSEGTVKRRVSSILAKTGYDSIMRLAVDVVSKGYIVPRLKGE